MNNTDKQSREDAFNAFSPNIQMVFRNRKADLFDDSKVFQLIKNMANLAFGNVNSPSIVTNQSKDEFEFANGIDFHYENGKPVAKGVR